MASSRCALLFIAAVLLLLVGCHAKAVGSPKPQWLSDLEEETEKATSDAKDVISRTARADREMAQWAVKDAKDEAANAVRDTKDVLQEAVRRANHTPRPLTELEKAEQRNMVFDRMLQLVNIFGQVENYLASKIRNAVTTVALVVDHDYNDRLERANKWRTSTS
ncbi:uncharacterized protein LOC126284823 [Schistocerca gregaria]|uniref:uncharacterized protein LOC126284823 n=1 Tax=Schistocerca gregaria TaxID=7010 RepID=UPI00211ED530|nr:uncharacterized protein LOC126284823 [Schistocerca gregaria]